MPLQATDALDVADVLAQARRATRVAQWQSAKSDLMLEGSAHFEGVDEPYCLTFSSSGQFVETLTGRLSQTTGFDSITAWQTDHSAMPLVLDGQDRAKALLVAWVLNGRWATSDCPFVASLLPDQTTNAQATLALKLPSGILAAKIVIDRQSWLPSSLTYTTQTGLQNWQFMDYRFESGLVLPHLWTHHDNDLMDTFTVRSVRSLGHTEPRYVPAAIRPNDTAWKPSASPQIVVKRDRVGEILVHPC
ncbi:MAG: hypothetical protein M3Y28_06150, partial [Armatimonadota bacterium]|nr:hypothetical protein [Armatimonadota bacterium]